MSTRDPRVDAYISKSADFAKPILNHLRELVHSACPDAEETIKWSFPHFMYGDRILCSMAAFKAHCSFGFWHEMNKKPEGAEGMGHVGKITSMAGLPKTVELKKRIKAQMKATDLGVKPVRPKSKPKAPLAVPDDLTTLLKKNKKAAATFNNFSPSHQREYIEWITEAKREETRAKRLATTLEWLVEGKPRHWKYANC